MAGLCIFNHVLRFCIIIPLERAIQILTSKARQDKNMLLVITSLFCLFVCLFVCCFQSSLHFLLEIYNCYLPINNCPSESDPRDHPGFQQLSRVPLKCNSDNDDVAAASTVKIVQCNVDEHKFPFCTKQKSPLAHLLQSLGRKIDSCKSRSLTSSRPFFRYGFDYSKLPKQVIEIKLCPTILAPTQYSRFDPPHVFTYMNRY